jgi:hypothetical protein
MGPKWVPDTKLEWPTDHRSQYNFDLSLLVVIRDPVQQVS